MKIELYPEGGKFGYGWYYICVSCGALLDKSKENLVHPAIVKTGKFWNRKTAPWPCYFAGASIKRPKLFVETEVITS